MAWWQDFFGSGTYTLLDEMPDQLTELQVELAVRELALVPAMRILDVACGIGRHGAALARRGMRVVGLDYSARLLAQARARAPELELVRGDMRSLPFAAGSFDAAVCLFNSLGYFDRDDDDARTLGEIARVLAPGAPLLLEVLHRDGIARHFEPRRFESFAGGHVEEERTWQPCTGRIESRWTFVRGDSANTLTSRNRVYTYLEVERMVVAAGVSVERVWGGWGETPLSLDDDMMILKLRASG